MKKILSLIVVILLVVTAGYSQSPGIFNYQGVARNSVGNVLANKSITLRLTIHDGSAGGPTVYQETRGVTTNPFGLFNAQVGSAGATNVTGTIAGANWGVGLKYIQVEIDPNGGSTLINIGTAQIASVPYSLYSLLTNDLVLPFNKTQADAGTLFKITNSGSSISGAIMGVTQTNAANAWGVHGRVDNTAAGGFSTGVLGTNLSTTGNGIGVTGSQNGSGWGVYGTTPSGIGVYGLTTSGTGVQGSSTSGTGGFFSSSTGLALNSTGSLRHTGINEALNRILASDAAGNALWKDPSAVGIVTGSGTVNFVPKWTPAGTNLGNSQIFDNGVAVGIGTNTPNVSALLDISSASKGMLTPRMTTAQRIAIATSAAGLFVYDTDTNSFWFYNGAGWTNLAVVGPTTSWLLAGNSGTNPATNFIGTTDNNDVIFKRNNIRAGSIGLANTSYGVDALNPLSTGIYNTANGYQALHSNTTGGTNTANGVAALFSNTTGSNNTANGVSALFSNTTGGTNTANGFAALYYNTTGSYNTANGYQVLVSNTTGSYNTANGYEALASNTTGPGNTATGHSALYSNTTGIYNTANGLTTLYHNTTGNNNTANGYKALYSNTTGSFNTANGTEALQFNTTGSANTATGVDALFFNTTGDYNTANGFQALSSNTTGSFNTANGYAALYHNTTGSSNTANGYGALEINTTGTGNTANGNLGLHSNTTGDFNTANGNGALQINTTGTRNTANGYQALYDNTTGSSNTANGWSALFSNTTGSSNTATGYNALRSNSIGSRNTANGWSALFSNINGSFNTAHGYHALFFNITGSNNTANGYEALYNNNDGIQNTANGYGALYANTSGDNNTATGDGALDNNTTGSNNTAIGTGADVSSGNLTNATAIGYNAVVNANNKIRLGNSLVQVIEGQVAYTFPSDGRFKTSISETVKGLDFIMKLRPVVYNFQTGKYDEFIRDGEKKDVKTVSLVDFTESEKIRHNGFIAQEVEKAAKAAGYEFDGVVVPKNNKETYGLSYSQFVVPLVKAVQEQQAIIETLQKQVEAAKAEIPMQIGKQQKMIEEMKKEIEELKKLIKAGK